MNHQKKIEWMAAWAAKNGAAITLEGIGWFGCECVGLLVGDHFPRYKWYDDLTCERLDTNGEVWLPHDAYIGCECVAVLGQGEEAEVQLYDWLRWFDKQGFKIEEGAIEQGRPLNPSEILLGKNRYSRMMRDINSEVQQ